MLDTEGPSDMYANEITHLFEDADTCHSKNMFTYASDDT